MTRLDIDSLRRVEKPSRYTGGEVNQIRKDLSQVELKVGLSYPDVYELGMSHIGLKIIYEILNRRPDIAAERVYAPWPDYEAILRQRGEPLTTLENKIPLSELDLIGFTLQYELSYTNLVNILDLGGVPLRAKDRQAHHPVVIGGGSCAYNPEPLALVMDAICIGDGEDIVLEVMDAVRISRKKRERREDLWTRLAEIQGCYVPSLYDVYYNSDGTVAEIVAKPGAPKRVRKRILADLNTAPYFTKDIVPNTEIIHDRYGVEVQRGCMRGCRFCQAGYVYRPERQRSPETVRKLVREGLAATGVSQYGLLSLSLGDYNCIEPLLLSLMDEHADQKAAISTPSMRLESVTPAIMDQIARVRASGFTVAPEAGSDRLRAVINKNVDEEVLLELVGQLFSRGWKTLKLYFMLGLPTETYDDLYAIMNLGSRCRQRARKYTQSPVITVSVSSFVPKSHTPFQWSPQITLEEIKARQSFLWTEARKAKLNYRNHEATSSIMEGVFSRGDRRVGEVLLRAHALGARMDGWQEHHRLATWDQALQDVGVERHWYNHRRRDVSEIFPWDHIDSGVKKEWLWEDWMASLDAGRVDDCSEAPCYDCGVCDHKVVHNRVYVEDAPGSKPRHRQKKRYIARSMEDLVQLPSLSLKRPEATAQALPLEAPVVEKPLGEIFDVSLPLEMRLRFRLCFAKRGVQALSGNHEVISTFQRALKRGGVPALFTKGLHPRMKTSVSPPIPMGTWSEAEFIDLEIKAPFEAAQIEAALIGQLPEGLVLLGAEPVPFHAPPLPESIESARWRVEVPPSFDLGPVLGWWNSDEPRVIETETKGRRRMIDVREEVQDLCVTDTGLELTVRVKGGGKLRKVLEAVLGADPIGGGFAATKLSVTWQAESAAQEPASAPVLIDDVSESRVASLG